MTAGIGGLLEWNVMHLYSLLLNFAVMVDVQPRFSTEVLAEKKPPTTWNHNTISYPQVVKQTTQHFVHIRMKKNKTKTSVIKGKKIIQLNTNHHDNTLLRWKGNSVFSWKMIRWPITAYKRAARQEVLWPTALPLCLNAVENCNWWCIYFSAISVYYRK